MDEAKQYMDKVANPVKSVNLIFNNAPGHKEIATAIQANWKKLGLNVTLKQQDWPQFLKFLGPPPDPSVGVYRNGWIADFPDDINFLSVFECGSGNNNTNWCNKKYDDLLKQATAEPDQAKRYGLYKQAESLLTGADGDMPIAPIYWYTFAYQVADNVHGWNTNPMDAIDLTQGQHRLSTDASSGGRARARPPDSNPGKKERTARAEVRRPSSPLDDPHHPPRHLHDVPDDARDQGQPVPAERACGAAGGAREPEPQVRPRPALVQPVLPVREERGDARSRAVARASQPGRERDRPGALPHLGAARGLAMLLAIVVGVPLGILAALRANRITDYILMLFANLGFAVPSFLVATLFIYFFAAKLGWFPTNGWGSWQSKVLPVVALSLGPLTYFARIVRGQMLETLQQDYVRTAKAKGLRWRRIVTVHVLRNSLIPAVTAAAPLLGYLVTGSFIIENIFAIPGIGRYYVTSVSGRDYSTVMGITVLLSVLIIVANLVVDILYGYLDPRTREART